MHCSWKCMQASLQTLNGGSVFGSVALYSFCLVKPCSGIVSEICPLTFCQDSEEYRAVCLSIVQCGCTSDGFRRWLVEAFCEFHGADRPSRAARMYFWLGIMSMADATEDPASCLQAAKSVVAAEVAVAGPTQGPIQIASSLQFFSIQGSTLS